MFTTVSILLAFLFSFIVWKYIRHYSNGEYMNSYYSTFYIFELLIATLLVFFDPQYHINRSVRLFDAIPMLAFCVSIACVAILLGQLSANGLIRVGSIPSINEQCEIISKRYNVTIVSNFFLISFAFTIFTSLNVSYIIAVFALSFSFSPAIIGLFWPYIGKTSKICWGVVLVINFIFHIMQGSRGTAMFPIIFFLMGYLIAIKDNRELFLKKLKLII